MLLLLMEIFSLNWPRYSQKFNFTSNNYFNLEANNREKEGERGRERERERKRREREREKERERERMSEKEEVRL